MAAICKQCDGVMFNEAQTEYKVGHHTFDVQAMVCTECNAVGIRGQETYESHQHRTRGFKTFEGGNAELPENLRNRDLHMDDVPWEDTPDEVMELCQKALDEV